MDYSTAHADGQPLVAPSLLPLVQQLCDLMQMLRAWWEHFEDPIRQIDRAAAVKACDLMVEGVITARQIARTLGLQLPPTDTVDWTLAPRRYRSDSELWLRRPPKG